MTQFNSFQNQSSGPIWVVQLAGQQPQAVDNLTLRQWAVAKYIQPTTQVQDSRNGAFFPASQIPGVYSDKEYVTALLLSFFLGGFGVDRFYTGHSGIGVAKLLTCGGCGIWALIDFILYAMRSVHDSSGLPLK